MTYIIGRGRHARSTYPRRVVTPADIGFVNVKDPPYNAVGNGVADDTGAIRAVIAAGNRRIFFPNGTYLITDTVTMVDLQGVELVGESRSNLAVIKWGGVSSVIPAIRMDNCREITWRNIQISADAANPLQTGWESRRQAGAVAPTGHQYHDCTVIGTVAGSLQYGWRYIVGTGTNSNNDNGLWSDCIARNFDQAGYSFEHTQSTIHTFIGSGALNNIPANTADGWRFAGTITVLGGSSSGNGNCDFSITELAQTQATSIAGFQSEGAGCFLETPLTSARGNVNVSACSMHSGALRGDNRIISFEARGTLTMTGCTIGSDDTVDGEIVLADAAATPSAAHIFVGCFIRSNLANPFTRARPIYEAGCSQIDNGVQTQRGVQMHRGDERAFFLDIAVLTVGSTTDFDIILQSPSGVSLQVGDLDPVADIGELMLQPGFRAYARDSADALNRRMLRDNGVGGLIIGDPSAYATTVLEALTSIPINVGGSTIANFPTSGAITLNLDLTLGPAVAAPKISQGDETTTANGKTLTVQAQSNTNVVSGDGGGMDVLPGASVAGAGGLGRLRTGDGSADRIQWDDIGVGFFAAGTVAQGADYGAITDNIGGIINNILDAIPDPADSPVDADALRDDLVANTLPEIRNALSTIAARLIDIRTIIGDSAGGNGLMA